MRIFKVFVTLTVFIVVLLLWLLIPGIGNEKKVKMQKQFTESVISDNLPNNYSIHLDIKTKYFVHIVSDKGSIIADYDEYLERERGYLENGVLRRYKNEKLISKEKCTFKQYQKRLGFDLEGIHKSWKQKIRDKQFDEVRCRKVVTMTGHDYTWMFKKETEKDDFTLFVDTDKSGRRYNNLGILYDSEERKGKVGYMMCFSNESPVGPAVITDEDFSEDTQCYTYKELYEKWHL